jgi:hypothetical protein
MQILQRYHDASEVISGYWFVEGWHFSDHIEHLFAPDVLHQKEDV